MKPTKPEEELVRWIGEDNGWKIGRVVLVWDPCLNRWTTVNNGQPDPAVKSVLVRHACTRELSFVRLRSLEPHNYCK